MKIAFTAKGTDWDSMIDPRFGRTEFILIYDDEKDEFTHAPTFTTTTASLSEVNKSGRSYCR